MTTTAIFLKVPAGLCIETDDDVAAKLFTGDPASSDDFLDVTRNRDGAVVLIPVDNIADIIIGGSRDR